MDNERSINRAVSPLIQKSSTSNPKTRVGCFFFKEKNKYFKLFSFFDICTGLYFSRFSHSTWAKICFMVMKAQVLQDLEVAKTPDLTRSPEPAAGLMLTENTWRETMPTQPTSQESGGKKLCQNTQCQKLPNLAWASSKDPCLLDDDIYYFLSMRFFPLFNLEKELCQNSLSQKMKGLKYCWHLLENFEKPPRSLENKAMPLSHLCLLF